MRLAPKSLAGQLTLLLLLALVLAQGVAVALFAWERMEALRDAHRDNAVLRTATVARLLGDTPRGLHASVIAAASTGLARFSLTAEPIVGETGAGERAAAIADGLSAALDMDAARVRVAPLRTRFLDDDDDRDDDDHHLDRDDDDDRDHDGDGDDDHRHREPDWFTASVALADGRWLNVAVGAPAWGAAFLAVFLLSALGIASVAALTGRRMAKPMRGLAHLQAHGARGRPAGGAGPAHIGAQHPRRRGAGHDGRRHRHGGDPARRAVADRGDGQPLWRAAAGAAKRRGPARPTSAAPPGRA